MDLFYLRYETLLSYSSSRTVEASFLSSVCTPCFPPSSSATPLKQTTNEKSIPRHPPRSGLGQATTQGHPTPCTFPSDGEHDTGPLHLCPPPLLFSAHAPHFHPSYLPPRASITSSQRPLGQKKRKGRIKKKKKSIEEYGRYHAEQCWPKYRLLSRALPFLAWPALQTHPLL